METLEPNGERGRSKPRKRRFGMQILMRPQTVKVLLSWFALLLKFLKLIYDFIEIFRK